MINIKSRQILISAIILSLVIEIILIINVYTKIGAERLPFQIVRLTVQLIFILLIFSKRHNMGLFLLSGYHVISGLLILFRHEILLTLELIFGLYHLGIGIVIYFHDWIEERLSGKS